MHNKLLRIMDNYSKRAPAIRTPQNATLLIKCILCWLMFGCVGCQTASKWKPPANIVGYSDSEVFSRQWTNQYGRVIRVLGLTVEKSKRFGDFLIVKVGDKNEEPKGCFSCEIYLIK